MYCLDYISFSYRSLSCRKLIFANVYFSLHLSNVHFLQKKTPQIKQNEGNNKREAKEYLMNIT